MVIETPVVIVAGAGTSMGVGVDPRHMEVSYEVHDASGREAALEYLREHLRPAKRAGPTTATMRLVRKVRAVAGDSNVQVFTTNIDGLLRGAGAFPLHGEVEDCTVVFENRPAAISIVAKFDEAMARFGAALESARTVLVLGLSDRTESVVEPILHAARRRGARAEVWWVDPRGEKLMTELKDPRGVKFVSQKVTEFCRHPPEEWFDWLGTQTSQRSVALGLGGPARNTRGRAALAHSAVGEKPKVGKKK